jgi:hypothetical protein
MMDRILIQKTKDTLLKSTKVKMGHCELKNKILPCIVITICHMLATSEVTTSTPEHLHTQEVLSTKLVVIITLE